MSRLMEQANIIGGACMMVLVGVFGQYWFLFLGFLALNIVDWLSGWQVAVMNHKSSSRVGAKGILKKVWYWVIIGIAFFIGFSFEEMGARLGVPLGFMPLVGWFVLANYLVNEIRSITENLVLMGVDVPEFFIRGLDVSARLIERAADSEIPKEAEKNESH
ncbi:phage holin family protein [Anaerotignum sp.]|uniref:phage holin family protein n=1 Tax=Anaerotignum sp. TaxID=2039241 RepID=UPI0028AF46D2|nr:phage holin family protein [Anaerotignum sp.]